MMTLRTATVIVSVLLLVIAGTSGAASASMPVDEQGQTSDQSVLRRSPADVTSTAGNQTLVVDGENDEDNEFATIQGAIDNATDGDRIEVRPGSYTEQLFLNKNITLIAPRGATLNGSTLGDDTNAISITPTDSPPSSVTGGSSAAPVIAGFTMTGYETGVNARFSTGNWTLRNVTFHHLEHGVDAQLASGSFHITQVTAHHTTEDAISLDFTRGDWRLDNTTIHSGTLAAISTRSSTGNYIIRDSIIRDTPFGIDAFNTSGRWRVRNVTLRNLDAPAIDTVDSSDDWIVRDTTIRNVSAEGIKAVRAAGDWQITYTTIKSASDGVDAENTSGGWRITQTTISQTDRGVNAGRSKGNWEITRTTIRDSRVWLISAREARGAWEVHQSVLVGNQGDGIDAINSGLEGDATRNWWGNASGPMGRDCVGNVDCSDPLSGPPTGALPNVTVTRSLGSTTIAAGGSTTVTLSVEVNQAVDRLSITESFTPAVQRSRLDAVRINGNTIIPTTATFENDTGVVVLMNLTPGDTVTVTYRVTLPANATSGETFDLTGMVTTPAETVSISQDTITIRAGPGRYAGSDNRIQTGELRQAISDWVRGQIDTSLLRQVISAWVTQSPV